MRSRLLVVPGICLAAVLIPSLAGAQGSPEPGAPPVAAPPLPSATPSATPPPAAPTSPAPPPAEPAPGTAPTTTAPTSPGGTSAPASATAEGGASASGSANLDKGLQLGAVSGGESQAATEEDADTVHRRESLKIQNSSNAATGLLHLYSADSGAPGTFRFSIITSYFAGSGFLCPACADPNGGPATASDEAKRVGGHVGISATPLPYLEAFMGVHASASSNNRETPHLLQALGDTNLGVKGFMPYEEDQIFTAGGAAELWLLNGTGAIGVNSASFGLRGMATADLSNRRNEKDRIPLRAHFNLGYFFDNSGKLVEDFENAHNGQRITRIERFGLDINRVDSLKTGIGVEGMFDLVRPFLEWTIDVPVNRQGHVCALSKIATGDHCLGNDAGFSTTPSRLTLGARVYPWQGLSFLAAFDIGTGATSEFIEEVRPEMPWNLYLGVAYAVDTKPRVEVKRVEVPHETRVEVPAQALFIDGTVVEKGTGTPIPEATVRFDGRDLTGMITSSDGKFRTGNLDPGTYTFNVKATGYRDGQCNATIAAPAAGATEATSSPAPGGTPSQQPAQPGQPPSTAGAAAVVTCELEALPKVGNVNGQLRDSESGAPVSGASVKITDKLGRSLTLASDAGGAFRFENVPPGQVTIVAEAPDYLRSTLDLEIKPHVDVPAQMSLHKRPKKANVVVTKQELKLKKAIHFQHDSAEILPDSMSIVEEIADVLRSHPEIPSVEIQGHTDDSGTPPYNLRLSADRANTVRDALIRNGVEPNRLTARGYGQEKPLVPNTNEANRAKNRRVQLMIQK